MKKVFLSKHGYAMTELLVASVVILGILGLLFANFTPLMTEYDNREYYNNVTSKYAAFDLRKMYINALSDSKIGLDMKAALNEGIAKNNYYKVYDSKNNIMCASFLLDDEEKCRDIINEYGIEEVIITNYKLENLKETYPRDGVFYNYINYLPKYKNIENGNQLYRLILKTKDFGYATTAILSNYKTDSDCFEGALKGNGEIEITNYFYDKKKCGEKVILSNEKIQVKDKSGNDISGIVTSIGKEAFLGKDISSFSYPVSVTEIKEGAFKNTKLEEFKFNATLTMVGKEAFSNTLIKEITVPNYVKLSDYAFSNNKNLSNITLNPGIINIVNDENVLAKGIFKNCGDGKEVVLSLPSSIEYIGEETFNDTYVKNLDFGNTNLKGIEKNAFSVKKVKETSNFALPNTLRYLGDSAFENNQVNLVVIPKKVKRIGSSCFEGSLIKSLVINSDEDLEIRNSAFKNNDITDVKNSDKISLIGNYAFSGNENLENFTITSSISKIGNGAFKDTKIGDKEGTFKTYRENISWCLVLFDSDKCKTLDDGTQIKVELNSKVKYINKEAGDGLG